VIARWVRAIRLFVFLDQGWYPVHGAKMGKEMNVDQSDRPNVSFIIPCYNEAQNVTGTVAQIEAGAKNANVDSYEIIIVNDCSTDNTDEVAANLAKNNTRITHISNERNLGFGGAYKEGVKHVRGVYVIMIPGDDVHPHASISPILRKAGEADIIIPYIGNPEARTWPRRITSVAFTGILNTLFRLDIPYYNGVVLHKLDLLRTVEIHTNGFAYQAEALIKLLKGGATYTTIPIEITERTVGKTSAFQLTNVYRVLMTIFTLWRDVNRSVRWKPSATGTRTARQD